MATPQELIAEIRKDSDYFQELCNNMADLECYRSVEVIELFATGKAKSMANAERLWEATDKGKAYIKTKWILKGLEPVLRAKKFELKGIEADYYDRSQK